MIANEPFVSVKCNREYVADMAAEALNNDCQPAIDGDSGYLLINRLLVPHSFVDQVDSALGISPIEYGHVLDETYLFEQEFLESLNELERQVLMHVVMHLIAQGKFGFQIFGQELEAA